MPFESDRRTVMRNTIAMGVAGAVALPLLGQSTFAQSTAAKENPGNEPEVTATEDLMREHGVLRRALLIFQEVVPKLRQNAASVDAASLQQAAKLFRTFGEDYHERMLEEQHIFPLIRKQSKAMSVYADILIEQHNRGREITDYVLAVTSSGKISAAHAEPLAKVFESF